jgi:glyoxylase-like metal-dependent hydrolase (beta-lactamase superfamily II)
MVEKVETWVDNPVLGDMLVEASYTDYKDFSGVKFPAKIVQRQGGFPVFDLTITDVKPNAAANIDAPPPAPPVTVQTEKIADGVWYLTGGSHHSVVVEFADHIAVVEGPQTEERASAVIAEAKKLVPSKPIRYVVNTHHHWDHSGGLRAFVAEGATIVTHELNKPYYEKNFALPHSLNPDRLEQNKTAAKFETMTDKKVLTDGKRTMELHHIQGNGHNDGIILAYLPAERIVVEADVFTPPADAKAAPPNPRSPYTVNLAENLDRLKLNYQTILPLHGRVTNRTELARFAK